MKCPRCNGKRCEPDNSGYLVGGFVTCIIFLWLSVTSKLRGYMSTETLIKLLLVFMIVIFVEASVILGGIILECVR